MTILSGRRFLLMSVVLLLVVVPPQLLSQVIIKERIEIHPKSAPLVRMQTASSLQIVARWSVSGELNPAIEPSIGMGNQFCQSYGTGDLVKTAPAVSGGYKILASVSTLESVAYELVVEVGGTEVLRQSGVTQPNVRLFLFPEVVLHSGVAFYAYPQEIPYGGTTGVTLGSANQHPLALCAETIWHQKMPTSFTITAGAALGSFYDLSGTSLGTSVELTEETMGTILFVADGSPPLPGGQDVIIQASNVTGVLGETTIKVLGPPRTGHFEIVPGADTLAHGTSTPLRVITRDADSLEIQEFGADQSVVLTLIGGGIQATAGGVAGEGSGPEVSASASYGSFVITPNYFDTVFVIPDQVTIPLQMLQMGEVTVAFFANGDFPPGSDPGVLTIRAEAEWNPSITGEGQVVVVRESECVKIVFAGPAVAPGDTTGLVFRKINSDGSETDFPPGQLFDVQILAGGTENGILLAPTGETGITLTAIQTPVRYIAPETIEGEEMTVQIVALPSSGGEGVQASSMSRVDKNSGSSSLALTKVKNKLLALAITACPVNNVTVRVTPDGILLKVSPNKIHFSEEVSLLTHLLYKGKPLPSGYDDILVNYLLASEFEGFGALDSGSGARGSTITGVRYEEAQKGSIKFVADGQEYDGRFPLGIPLATSAEVGGELLVNASAAYLFGPNTTGIVFLQNDLLWETQLYDHDTSRTIGGSGCALTCIAMILKAYGVDVDPKRLNLWMKDPKNKGYNNLDVSWRNALIRFDNSPINEIEINGDGLQKNPLMQDRRNLPPDSLPSLLPLDAALAEGRPVIAQVLNPNTQNNHWVVVTGKTAGGSYKILDPGGYSRVLLDNNQVYKTIYRYVLIK